MSDAVVWNHAPAESTAKWNGIAMKVRMDGLLRWTWEVRTSGAICGSRGIDRLGACADAESVARNAHSEEGQ